ncbi:hypothetical protein Taro_056061 [Colocasia esculenta]|uniref:Uncharacterized protein n=1 Tax=Colocasia esculenta TaxID=4460 RepID=A0A843XVG6_COLES|nr:hypothetical protein [Colocasia esculenta]
MMILHKMKRGRGAALARLKVYEGVSPPCDKMKKMVIPNGTEASEGEQVLPALSSLEGGWMDLL